jgi:aspartate 1-decarboxylase
MQIQVLKSKLHRATVTDGSLNYQGSLGIDEELMELAGILPYEKLLVGNITNGHRFETYAITAPRGSRAICLNGAVARLGTVGDLLVIMTFCSLPVEVAKTWRPTAILLDAGNHPRVERSPNTPE